MECWNVAAKVHLCMFAQAGGSVGARAIATYIYVCIHPSAAGVQGKRHRPQPYGATLAIANVPYMQAGQPRADQS